MRDLQKALNERLPVLFETLPMGSEWNNIALSNDPTGNVRAFAKVPGAKIVSGKR